MQTSAQPSTTLKKSRQAQDIGITVRRMDLEFPDDIPEFWFHNNPLLTMFLTAFSCAFPEGERQFIHSVRLYQDQIRDPRLQSEVRAFIGQEAHHGKEHDALNDMMRRKGYSVDRIYSRFRKMNRLMQSEYSAAHQLAATVCVEHVTAIMADYFFRTAPQDLDRMDERVRKIWVWHAIEETEHKAVTFDVYKAVVNRPWLLRLAMLEVTLSMFIVNGRGTIELLRESGQMSNLKSWREGLVYLFGPSGMMASLRKPYRDFFRRDFHPWDHDNREAMNRFKAEYLGEAPEPSTSPLPAPRSKKRH